MGACMTKHLRRRFYVISFLCKVPLSMYCHLDSLYTATIWVDWTHDDVIFRVTAHLCGNSPVTGEFPTQRPVTRSVDVFFDLCLNKRLSKQSWGWRFVTLWRELWRHRNESTKSNVILFWFHRVAATNLLPSITALLCIQFVNIHIDLVNYSIWFDVTDQD